MADAPLPAPPTTETAAGAQRRARRGTLITLGVLAVLVALVVLLTPVSDNASNDTRLTTLRYGGGNARLAADLARQLGWTVRTTDTPLTGDLDTTVIYAVFGGPTPMTKSERDAVQRAVTRGAGMLLAPSADGPSLLAQSLGLRSGRAGKVHPTPLGTCPPETDRFSALRVRPNMLTFDTVRRTTRDGKPSTTVPFPKDVRTLLSSDVTIRRTDDEDDDAEPDGGAAPAVVATAGDSTGTRPTAGDSNAAAPTSGDSARRDSVTGDSAARTSADSQSTIRTAPQPSVVAFPLGRGRVVAMADPDLLRTDQLRNCTMGTALTFVRGLEYLSEGRQRTIVFSEYYQVLRTDGPSVVLGEWLRGTGLGRMVLTMLGACIVLLLARGRRTLAPVYRLREERRSALEHVDALATAWEAVRGTRTVARMLARGIRRRHAAGRWRSLDDTAFLAALAERHPAIADDAARLTRAIESPAAPSDLPALRTAAAHIDAECLTP